MSDARTRLSSWDLEADLAAVRSYAPMTGAEKPQLDQEACDAGNEAANVDGRRDVFMVDPLVPTQVCPAAEVAVPLTQEAMGEQAPPTKKRERVAPR